MEIETIRNAYDRWQKADSEWIETTLDLGRLLAEAKKEHVGNNEFGAWLDLHCNFGGVKFRNQRSAFVEIGENQELARTIMEQTLTRSIELIGREVKIRCQNHSDNNSTGVKIRCRNRFDTNSTASENPSEKLTPRLCVQCKENHAAVGRMLCQPCLRIQKSNSTPRALSRKKGGKKGHGKLERLPITPPDSFLIELVDEIRKRRKEAGDRIGRNKSWSHHGIRIADMVDILDWIVNTIDGKIQELTRAAL